MEANINNSSGIRNICVVNRDIPISKRMGWENAFKEMAKNGDDDLIIPDFFNDENIIGWKWESKSAKKSRSDQ